MHCQKSPLCVAYLRKDRTSTDASAVLAHKRDHSAMHQPQITTTKRASVLRCEMQNNFDHSGTAIDDMLSDDDDFVFEENDNLDVCDGFSINAQAPSQSLPFRQPFMYSTDQKWTIALLKLLDDMNAPDYAFARILKWAQGAQADGYTFQPANGGLSRTRNVDVLFASLTNAKRLLPSIDTVQLNNSTLSDVITFEFVPQLLNLLQNPALMTAEKLAIDPLNPLMPYNSPDGRLGEALSGTVYRNAYDRLITNPNRQLFVPIIQWIDRTTVTGNDRYSLKPYMFTPAIFKEKFRRTIQAWGYHGFLPKSKDSSAQNKTKSQGDNVRDYHAQLYKVLESFTSAGPQLCNVTLPIGPTGSMCVDIVTCILCVIQDMQEGDMLCRRFGPHTPNIRRHCRACDVSYEELDNPDAVCSFVLSQDMAQIAHSSDASIRQQWSQHYLNNAYDYVPMADPVRGIFGATPVETMHALRKGIIELVTFCVLEHVPARQKAKLDELAVHFHKSHRQTYRKVYPATDFSNGITNLTKITAKERLGLVFLFVILSQYDEGWQILSDALLKHGLSSLPEIIHVFEGMLCFDAWTNKETYWKFEHHAASKLTVMDSIRGLLRDCQDHIPLAKNKTWKFPKYHELLHLLDDMERFGAPNGFCAERPESLLIPVAKQPGRRAQKRNQGSSYELQAAQRLSYSIMIDTFHKRIWKPIDPFAQGGTLTDELSTGDHTGNATFGTVTGVSSLQDQVRWDTSTSAYKMNTSKELLMFLCQTFLPPVRICTEFVHNGHTYRCHPNYQSGGPIFDWMNIQFKNHRSKTIMVYPSRLAAVVVNEEPDVPTNERYQLIVQCATKKTNIKSVLLTEWFWSDVFHVVHPSNIVAPCFVVSIKKDTSKILETLPFEDWPNEFTDPSSDGS